MYHIELVFSVKKLSFKKSVGGSKAMKTVRLMELLMLSTVVVNGLI